MCKKGSEDTGTIKKKDSAEKKYEDRRDPFSPSYEPSGDITTSPPKGGSGVPPKEESKK